VLIGDIVRYAAERFPNKTGVIDKHGSLTFAQLDSSANRFANALKNLGVLPGSKVAILSPNCSEYAVSYFGIAQAGCISVNISTRSTPRELSLMLEATAAEVILVGHSAFTLISTTLHSSTRVRIVISFSSDPSDLPGRVERYEFGELLNRQGEVFIGSEIDHGAPAGITFTGGTTGIPKPVLTSHRARSFAALISAIEFGTDERDIIGQVTPLFHSAGLFVWFTHAVLLGATVVILESWSAEEFVEAVEKEMITAAFLVPTQISDLLSSLSFDAKRLGSLKKLNYAGAPMPKSIYESLKRMLPWVELTEHYGQAETGPIAVRRPFHPISKSGTVGRATIGTAITIVGENGQPLESGNIGEVVVTAEHLLTEYYRNPDDTAYVFRYGSGHLATRDIGFLDEERFLTLVDRSDDVIISGGENIFPSEIENALCLHPDVTAAAVIGIPDERLGEVPAAYVVLRPTANLDETALLELCAAQISRHKRPRVFLVIDSLPRTAAGKIQRRVLRELFSRKTP